MKYYIRVDMKLTAFLLACLAFSTETFAQYFYKDLVVTNQAAAQLARYKDQGVHHVKVTSYESDGEPTEDFTGARNINNTYTQITTSLQSPLGGASELTSTFNAAGQLTRSRDTTDGSGSTSEYTYDSKGNLVKMLNLSVSVGQATEREEHLWTYGPQDKPEKMLRIKNNSDTTYVSFVKDEKGNVVEENSRRNGVTLPSVYYYYDDENRLTDIVSYNDRAKRLLPMNVFEYNQRNQVSSMLVVQEGTDDYQKWLYEYNEDGLRVRETCLNKRKQLMGKIGYEYQ